MITEQEILDAGFVDRELTEEGYKWYRYTLERKDLSTLYTYTIYDLKWDSAMAFEIFGSVQQIGTMKQKTKYMKADFTSIEDLIKVLEVFIAHDLQRHTRKMG
jgi:hypothetical protein